MKTNIRALNACLGIDGPDWMEMDDDIDEFIQEPPTPWNYGIEHTEETKELIRQKAIGRVASVETRDAMRKAQLGRKHPEKVKRKIGEAQVGKKNHNYQYDWKFTFECGKTVVTSSMPTWCRENGYDKAALMRVCKKQVGRHKDIVTVEKVATKVATGCQA